MPRQYFNLLYIYIVCVNDKLIFLHQKINLIYLYRYIFIEMHARLDNFCTIQLEIPKTLKLFSFFFYIII